MLMYDLLAYTEIYSMTTDSLWNYYRDEVNDDATKKNADIYRINSKKTSTSKSFQYKAKMIGKTPIINKTLHAKIVAPSKYLSNFWRSLNWPFINCEIELDLSWLKNSIISDTSRTAAVAANVSNLARAGTSTTSVLFQINNIKLYVTVVTLSINNNIIFLEQLNQGFKRTIFWNRYRSEIKTQPRNNNLD